MAVILGVVAGFLGTALQLGKCFAEPIKRQFNYLCCFNTNIQNLRDEAQRLDDTRSGLQMKVDAEENNAQIVVAGVKTWFNDVDGIQAKNTEIEAEITTFRQNGCFAVKSRFSLGKKVRKRAEDMKDLREEGSKFTIIAQPPPPAAVVASIPLGSNIFEFDSRKQIEEEIIVHLKDENVNKLGICGMGGVGKTTMAKRIMHRVRVEHLFDEIVMAVFSQKPDRLGIQGVIAKQLGLELKDKEIVPCRALDLHARLSAGAKRSLIVLDDVWEVLNLEELGMPCESGCKILLTSRDRDILKRMDVEKVSAVRVLSETEAWDLFKSKAGSCIEQENVINAVAQQVVNECQGLPIALVTVGVALKDEADIRGWNHALNQLKSANPNHMPEVIEAVYKPLRFSYESLKSVDHKSLFLLCCLFPEDHNIRLEDLAIYAMGLHMFRDIRSLKEARETVFSLVKRLKSCFLLLEGDSESHVKMHDVVRDVAIFIASDERLINCDDCTWIASCTEERFGLHMGSAVYPNLHLLLIDNWSRNKELEIGDDFFEGMGELNLFSIEYSSLRRLPKTTKLMKNLKTLILDMCKSLESISVVGELINLEILICRQCWSIECLPIEMTGISRLRLLELSGCENLKTIAPGIISNQKGLEELIVEDFDNWEAADEERERKNASLSELEQLSRLSHLKIKIKDYRVAAGHKGLSPNMVKYDITIGDDNEMYFYYSEKGFEKVLKLTLPGSNSLGMWIHECVRSVEYMWLEGSDDSSLDFGTAHNMRSLTLNECSTVKKLVNTSSSNSATVFPLLESLRLEELSELEEICEIDCPMQSNSFQNLKDLRLIRLPALKHLWNNVIRPNQQNFISSFTFNKLSTIYISNCHGLRSLFSLSVMARDSWFVQLESLEIWGCDMMEQVFLWNEEENQTNIHIPLVFPKLKKLELSFLPRLTSFSKGIFLSIEFPLLEEMEVVYCPLQSFVFTVCPTRSSDDDDSIHLFGELDKVKFGSLKVVRLKELDKGRNSNCCPQIPIDFFNELRELKLSGFKSLKSLFSLSRTESNCLLQLEELEIERCDMMEQVLLWNEEENQRNNGFTLQFPKLKKLELSLLPRLTSFSKGIFQSIEFPRLEKMEVRNCPLLKGLVSSASSDDYDDVSNIQFFSKVKFDRLTKLVVGESVEMGRNWHQFPTDLFTGLCELEVSGFKEMKGLFSQPVTQSGCLLQLEKLEISDCEIMEQIILWNEEESQKNIHIAPFPKLKVLSLESLPRLTSFCKRIESIVEFSVLERLVIRSCPILLESYVSTSTSSIGPPHDNDDSIHLFCKPNKVEFGSLKELSISNCDSMRNWCGQISIDFFAVLCQLKVSRLKGMKSLFPCSIARNLRNLVQLYISNCEEMVKVIEDEAEDAPQISLFPNLKSLYLLDLEKLKSFCELRCTLQLPKLEHLDIRGCDVMDEFTLGALNTPNLKTIVIDCHDSSNEVNKALQQHRLKREKELETRRARLKQIQQIDSNFLFCN